MFSPSVLEPDFWLDPTLNDFVIDHCHYYPPAPGRQFQIRSALDRNSPHTPATSEATPRFIMSEPQMVGTAANEYGNVKETSGWAERGYPAEQAVVVKRRAPIACRRCRRMRTKCVHQNGKAPCDSCLSFGKTDECIFPVRGQPDGDRDYRHPRKRNEKTSQQVSKTRRSVSGPSSSSAAPESWKSLPPLDELVHGVNKFTKNYFQLGFLPKKQFPERLANDHRCINVFLLLSILSISARLSSKLVARYGTELKATDFFMKRAQTMAETEVYEEPTLERCQAFYLLSIAQQGSGLRNKSYMNMGIATRMAILMSLHREETYHLEPGAPMQVVMRAESARRTLWMLHSQDSLHSGPMSPVSLSAADITTLLPSNEEDFAAGRQPKHRAALEGTPPALENPTLVNLPDRSLFASLMQIHHLWGTIGRRAVNFSRSSMPWDPTSQFSKTLRELQQWEATLPATHKWSPENLKMHKASSEELAYLCVTMMTRLCNIVLRRPYLQEMIERNESDPNKKRFFHQLGSELFTNVRELYIQVDAQFSNRDPEESVGAQIASFCIYSCGLFAIYLCKHPHLCSDQSIAMQGPIMVERTISILTECKKIWPLTGRWIEALTKFSQDPKAKSVMKENSMDDSKDPIPHALPPFRALAAAAAASTTSESVAASSIASSEAHPSPSPVMSTSSTRSTNLASKTKQVQDLATVFSQPPMVPQRTTTSVDIPMGNTAPVQTQLNYSPPQRQMQQQLHLSPPQQPLPQQQQQYHLQTQAAHHPHAPAQMPMNNYMPIPSQPTAIPGVPLTSNQMDGLGMLADAYNTQNPKNPQPHGNTFAAPVIQPVQNYFPQLGPTNDGFENELQFYIDGANTQEWSMPSDGWLSTGL